MKCEPFLTGEHSLSRKRFRKEKQWKKIVLGQLKAEPNCFPGVQYAD